MSNIVIEGIDNAGKSTLARHISRRLNWFVQSSEGPPHHPGEMNERLKRYSFLRKTVFDRHPAVSQEIYSLIRPPGYVAEGMDPKLVEAFYDSLPLFIYCDPIGRRMTGHVLHDGVDSEEHLRQVEEGYDYLLKLYRAWAIRRAHIIYRIGDDMTLIADWVYTYTTGANHVRSA